jgi:hemolysin activation/secretion protein
MRAGVRRLIAALVAALVVVAIATAAVAQPVPPNVLPGRERERFTPPTVPLSQPGGTAISLPSTVAPPGADKINVRVRGIVILGMTVYTKEQVAPLYADMIGKQVTLQAIYDLAQKITTKYGNDGYVISRAIVPPQELNPGGATIRIQVIEGYVDKVEWPKALDKYVYFFSYYTEKIIAERPSNIHTIERYLLLAGDLPGLKFKNSLKPSPKHQGAATLVVEVLAEKMLDVVARVDNRGTQSQGPLEGQVTATINNPFRIHDAWTFTYAGPFKTEELKYVYGQYSQVLLPEGLQFFVDASDGAGRPKLSGDFALIAPNYQTRSAVVETGLMYPFIRTRERNLSMTGLFFMSRNATSR